MIGSLLGLDYRRRKAAARCPPGPLKDFLAMPFPPRKADWRQVPYAALDLETTGLNPKSDLIVSVGMVGMHGPRIDLATAAHRIVRADGPLSEQSVVIHRLTHDTVEAGDALPEVLGEVLHFLAGKVLIAHHSQVEVRFLARACAQVYQGQFVIPVVDTQELARQWFRRRDRHYTGAQLRLFSLREHYNLPRYRAHDALSDALAAAELFAAQMAERTGGGSMPLKSILSRT